jgi:CspA family cold shock protein
MSLIVNIVISIAVAAVATALTTWYSGDTHAALLLFIAFSGATIVTAMLVSLANRSKAEPAQQGSTKSPRTHKSPGKPASSAAAGDGPREQGQVKWFNVSKGFGFITKDDGEEIFVHFRSIRGGGRRGLNDGQRVSFVVAESDKGPQAEDVEGIN